MRANKISTGLVLIGIAVVMMLSAIGVLPDIPWFKLLCAVGLGSWAIQALLRRDFFSSFFTASVIAWIFEDELMIEHLAPFPLCVAAALLGLGLNMIFGKKKRMIHINYRDGENWKEGNFDDLRNEEWQDGRTVVLENNFNSTNKYVNSAAFSNAKLENNFGNLEIIVSVVLNEKEDSIERLFFACVFCQNTHIVSIGVLFVLFIKIIVRFVVSAGVAWFVFSEMP